MPRRLSYDEAHEALWERRHMREGPYVGPTEGEADWALRDKEAAGPD